MRRHAQRPSGARLLARAAASSLFLAALLTAAPATAGPGQTDQDPAAAVGAPTPKPTPASPPIGHAGGTGGTAGSDVHGSDVHVDREQSHETQTERDLALAATWHVDPELLVPQPGDSDATAEARAELAAADARLDEVLDDYDAATATADGAAVRARDARSRLTDARAVAAVAAARYRADRALLASVMVEAYTTSSTGPFGMLFSADTDQDLVTGMLMLQEMGRSQSRAVVAAQRSRDRWRTAAAAVARAVRRAETSLEAAQAALARAEAARGEVLVQVADARSLLEDSVLADQIAAARTALQQAAMSPAAAQTFVEGDFGEVAFPLPADAVFVDQDNWGHRSGHWASVHTGDDLSAACGTPVLAATAGTVAVRTDQSWSGQWLVMVSTGPGRLTTWYAHLETLLVSDGDRVSAGQPIGAVGAEGNATGCHLHFELHPDGGTIYEDHADPAAWLHALGVHPGDR